jgi:hypothetical protein
MHDSLRTTGIGFLGFIHGHVFVENDFSEKTVSPSSGKRPVLQPLMNFPAFYGTRRFITAFTTTLHLFLP